MGAKASLFPWNHHGVVVVSYHEGVPSLIWLFCHPETGAVAKIAHSEALKRMLSKEKVESELRTDAALTMALLGLIAEEAMISTQLHGKVGRRLKQAT